MFGHRFFAGAFFGQHYFGQAAGVVAAFVASSRAIAAAGEIRVVRPDEPARVIYPESEDRSV